MRLKPITSNFTAGEWSPRLHGRSELAKYWNAVETLENFIILPQGGITRRPGFHFAKAAWDPTRKCRLIPFVFSTEQAYIIEAGDQYFRFYMNHGQIQSIPSAIKFLCHFNGSDGSTTFTDDASAHTMTAGGGAKLSAFGQKFGSACLSLNPAGSDFVSMAAHSDFNLAASSNIFSMDMWINPTNNNGAKQTIYFQRTDTNNYVSLELTSSSSPLFRSYLKFSIVSGGGTVVSMQASSPEYVLWGTMQHVRVVENGDAYYMFLDGHLIASSTDTDRAANYTGLVYIGANNGAAFFYKGLIDEFSIFKGTALSTADFTPPTTQWGVSGTETPYHIDTPYLEEELSSLKWAQSADTLWIVHPNHQPAKLTRTGHTAWSLDAISFTQMPDWGASKGWPAACSFHEQRFCYAGTKTYPQTVWLSKSGDYDDFTTGTDDEDSCTYTVPADQVDGIKWISSQKSLVIGTGGGEFLMNGGEVGITPTSIDVKSATPHRCYDTMPLKVGPSTIFIQKYSRKVREMAYRFDDDAYHAPDLCLLAEHITLSGLKYLVYQQEPDSIIWAVRNDGVLAAQCYMREEEIVGWGRHITDGVVESVAVIPDPSGSFDELWAVVNRTIGGVESRYIEYLDPAMPVDSGITYSGAAVSSVSNLDHLKGETVDILGDGIIRTQAVVDSSGEVTISGPAASLIYVGLPFTSKVVTMKPNLQVGAGTTTGMPKKWAEIYVDLLESSGVEINGDQMPFRTVGDVLGAAVDPYTGFKKVSKLGWNDGRITIEQSLPLPCTIRGIYGTLEVGD